MKMCSNDNYAAHAAIWDWGGCDRSAEFEKWRQIAERFGKYVLIPFCALGECGAYMAEHGLDVTAFDITPEMIAEGKKRFGNLPELKLYTADITDFHFDGLQADFCFVSGDFGHIHTLGEVKQTLCCIGRQLREGGGLVIEAGAQITESRYTLPQTFYPKAQVYPDKKVWKVGDGRADAENNRFYISQKVYIEDAWENVEQFDHSFYLQNYTPEEWKNALTECGFDGIKTYDKDGSMIFEAAKKRTYPIADSEVLYLLRELPENSSSPRCVWLTENDGEIFNRHLCLCGKAPREDDFLRNIYKSGSARYCLLFENGLPVARGAVEPYSDGMWEAADFYTAREYRGRGLAKEILRHVAAEIIRRGKIVSCRTERGNTAMIKIMEHMGFQKDDNGGNKFEW